MFEAPCDASSTTFSESTSNITFTTHLPIGILTALFQIQSPQCSFFLCSGREPLEISDTDFMSFLTPNYSVKALIQTHGLTCSLHQPPSDSWVKALCSLYAGSPTPLHVTCCMKRNPQTSESDNNKWQKFKRTASWYHVSAGVETEINRVTVDKTNYYQVKYLRIMSVNFTR